MSRYLTDAALSAPAYVFLLTSNPRNPTITPAKFFAAPLQRGQGDLRKDLDPTTFYGQLYVGRAWKWTRDDLFYALGGPTYTEKGFRYMIQKAIEEEAKAAQLANAPPPPWSIEDSVALLHQDQEHMLHWCFAQENLDKWVILEDGGQHPLNSFWIEPDAQHNGASVSPKKGRIGRPPLQLNAERRETARAAKRLHSEGKSWDDVAAILHYNKRTLKRWIGLLDDEENQTVNRSE